MLALGVTDLRDDTWHHLAAVFDRNEQLTVYVDGDVEISDVGLANHQGPIINNDPIHVYFGRGNVGSYPVYFNGEIAELRIWLTARTQSEIIANMKEPLTGIEPGLHAYWPLKEGAGQVLFDEVTGLNGISWGFCK